MDLEKEENSQSITSPNANASVGQEQIHNMLFNRELGWQEIIYDLINTEQLDPWNINITILTDRYLERVAKLEEADFFVSSKVLLAASLLLRIKSEILLNKYIKSIDEILFGAKEKKKYETQRIELDEVIPELYPRSPIPRFKKVTLQELMESLGKAIKTENRRIAKEITHKNALREVGIALPKRTISIKSKIKELYANLILYFKKEETKKISFTQFIGENKDDKIISFGPLLHLENQKKVWLDQDAHFEEIYIWLKHIYLKHNPDPFKELRDDIEEEIKELSKKDTKTKKRIEQLNKDFENPIGSLFE